MSASCDLDVVLDNYQPHSGDNSGAASGDPKFGGDAVASSSEGESATLLLTALAEDTSPGGYPEAVVAVAPATLTAFANAGPPGGVATSHTVPYEVPLDALESFATLSSAVVMAGVSDAFAPLQPVTESQATTAVDAAPSPVVATSSAASVVSRAQATSSDGMACDSSPDFAESIVGGRTALPSLLGSALQERFAQALRELAACRELLDERSIPHGSVMSCKLEDHADVLLPSAEAFVASVPPAQPAQVRPLVPAPAPAPPPGSSAAAPAQLRSATEISRDTERLEEELSMAKALLMLSNVSLSMDLDLDDGVAAPAAQVVRLKGSCNLIKLLLALKQKVSLLNQQYLLLRGDMQYLIHEMNVCRNWVLKSFRTAVQHQSQEHGFSQTRFDRLSKALN